MKRNLRIIVVGSLLIFVSIVLFAWDYISVSSKYAIAYHRPACEKALRIDPRTKVTFTAGKEALDAGKQPCRLCNPATKD